MAYDGIGYGATLAGSVSGAIGNITNVTLGGRTRASIDMSSSSCATSKYREFIAGLVDEGEITAEIILDTSNAGICQALTTAFEAGTAETWTITWPSTASFAASGFITSLGVPGPFDDKLTLPITIKLTGKGIFTPVAA